MKKYLSMLIVAFAAFALFTQTADARRARVTVYKASVDPRVSTVAFGAGAASTATFFALNRWHWGHWNQHGVGGINAWQAWGITTVGCLAISPMVASAVVNRPLTMREAHVLAGSCVIPIVGGWLVNAAFDANPQWEANRVPRRARRHR
jgi:hypothetical protein